MFAVLNIIASHPQFSVLKMSLDFSIFYSVLGFDLLLFLSLLHLWGAPLKSPCFFLLHLLDKRAKEKINKCENLVTKAAMWIRHSKSFFSTLNFLSPQRNSSGIPSISKHEFFLIFMRFRCALKFYVPCLFLRLRLSVKLL